jgi:hypothetical protein
MTARTLLASAALAAGLAVPVAVAPPALALSCVGPDRVLDDADVVYTGRVVDSGDGRVLVEVEEVWRGGPVDEEVWLAVQLEGWTEWAGPDGRIPDGFSTSGTWVFAPDGADIGPCTAWALDSQLREHVEEHRPAQPDAPVDTSGTSDDGTEAAEAEAVREQGGPTSWPVVGGLAGVLAAIGVAALLLGRRRGGRQAD